MKYVILILLTVGNVLYGMERSQTRTRSDSFDEELRAREEMLRRQLEESEKELPPLPNQSRTSVSSEHEEALPIAHRTVSERETKADQARVQERATTNVDSKRSTAATVDEQPKDSPLSPKKEQLEEETPRLSSQEFEERKAFIERFKAAYLKSKAGGYLDNYIAHECNNNEQGVEHEHIDVATRMFLSSYGEVAFTPIKQTQHAIHEELKQCRGGKAGQFAYNFYNPAWQREIVSRHHKKLLAEELLLVALACCYKNTEDHRVRAVLALIKKHFSYKQHEQARLLLRDAENCYRYGIYKFLHAVHMNPRRFFVALAAAAVIIYASYQYYHRDY